MKPNKHKMKSKDLPNTFTLLLENAPSFAKFISHNTFCNMITLLNQYQTHHPVHAQGPTDAFLMPQNFTNPVFPPDRATAGIPRCIQRKAPRKMEKGPI